MVSTALKWRLIWPTLMLNGGWFDLLWCSIQAAALKQIRFFSHNSTISPSDHIQYLPFLNLLLLLLEKLGRYSGDVLLCTHQQLPQFAHEVPRILGIEEAGDIDLQVLTAGVLSTENQTSLISVGRGGARDGQWRTSCGMLGAHLTGLDFWFKQ